MHVILDEHSPLVVYIHGGGWCLGTAFTQSYDWMCASLSRDLNWRVLSTSTIAYIARAPVPVARGGRLQRAHLACRSRLGLA